MEKNSFGHIGQRRIVSQLRGANGQNENLTNLLPQGTQNSIIFGQTTISKKSNTGGIKNYTFVGLPKEKIFAKCNKENSEKMVSFPLDKQNS